MVHDTSHLRCTLFLSNKMQKNLVSKVSWVFDFGHFKNVHFQKPNILFKKGV